jgi:hypothetical protein
VVNGIYHRLFDGGIRIIPETLGFGPVGVFDNRLFEIVGLDMAQCVTSDTGKRACKGLLVKAIPTRPLEKGIVWIKSEKYISNDIKKALE